MFGNRRNSSGSARVANHGSQNAVPLREDGSGRNQTRAGTVNAKSMLKMEYLQKLAVWASGNGSVPSLGAFFGHRLAECREAISAPPDSSLFQCQRCESILEPGRNCAVRIEKNRMKRRRRHKKPNVSTQNNVVYHCQFCSHKNLKRGTPEGYMKQICPLVSKQKVSPAKSNVRRSVDLGEGSINKLGVEVMDCIDAAELASNGEEIMTQKSMSMVKDIGSGVQAEGDNEISLIAERVGQDEATQMSASTYGDRRCCDEVERPDNMHSPGTAVKDGEAQEVEIPVSVDESAGSSQIHGVHHMASPANDRCSHTTNVAAVVGLSAPADSPAIMSDKPVASGPVTPVIEQPLMLLDSKRRKRKTPGKKKAAETESAPVTIHAEKTKKRRKSKWTSLREMTERSEQEKREKLRVLSSFAIPFTL